MSQRLEALLVERRRRCGDTETLEDLLTSVDGFGLTTASPLQRAICRIADGRPLHELARVPEVIAAIGDVEALPRAAPAEVLVLSGIRTAKSMISAAASIRAAQTCQLAHLGPGEVPRVSVVSTTTDLAHVVYRHIVGNMLARPRLRARLVEEPKADSVLVRHPSGRVVEIKVVAGARAGASLVARWSAGVVFDEAPRMLGADEGVVNLDDARAAVIGRMLPGAQIWTIGSPWAPQGPVYKMVIDHWMRPTPRLVVIRAPGPAMNPVYWTPERCAELARTDPDAHRTDVLAEFTDPEESLFPSADLDRATRKGPLELPREPRHEYAAAMDPATRGNAWTLVIATKRAGKKVVVLAMQWQGSKSAPLKSREVLLEIAAICKAYGIESVITDRYAIDPLRELASDAGLGLVESTETMAPLYLTLRRRFSDGEIELPPHAELLADLRAVRKRVTQSGIAIVLPKTADGRHCDFAPSLVLALRRWLDDPMPAGAPPGTPEAADEMAARYEREQLEDLEQPQREWWEQF